MLMVVVVVKMMLMAAGDVDDVMIVDNDKY